MPICKVSTVRLSSRRKGLRSIVNIAVFFKGLCSEESGSYIFDEYVSGV